jgi:hypothetical protein
MIFTFPYDNADVINPATSLSRGSSYRRTSDRVLLPDPADSLLPQGPDPSKDQPSYHVHLPWAFNLDVSGQLFGKHLDEGSSHDVEVCGLLSGGKATFKVVQANLLWQSVGPILPPPVGSVLASTAGQHLATE